MATKKATRRKKRKSSVAGNSTTIGGIRFTKSSCHTTKSAANSKAKDIRDTGYTARVVGKCVYKGRKRKK